ncbi:Ig-like domain-containing protein [Marinimicrobium sp. C2-29]|uniref:Ig-like domain-containing protein n=1 Tax=Marinimicrobium sp. C2-29 TaxID=3139825 RepID=UPI003138E894
MKTYATVSITALTLIMVGCGGSSGKGGKTTPDLNQGPTASDASFTTQTDTEVTGTLNAEDPEGDPVTFAVVDEPENGSVMLEADGSFSYQPGANFTGNDSFSFRASDGDRDSNLANVEFVIEPLEVSFSTYSRQAFGQMPTDEPLPVNGRVFIQDVAETNAYDDLLTQ